MKKMRKITLLLVAFILSIVSTVSVSAAKIGDPYSYMGVQIGWILVIAAIIVGLLLWYVLKKAPFKKTLPILGFVIVIGLLLALTDVSVPVETGQITPDVEWTVTAASDTDDITINNDARTITKLIWADVDLAVINATDDSVWAAATDDPWINFTISPALEVGVSSTTNQATTRCSVLTPDQSFTEDSTVYDLFEDASTGGDKNLPWTTDGTTDYESKLCTVTIGSSEVAQLKINLLDDGLSQLEAGESQAFLISVGGVTYTMTVIVTALT